MSKPSITGYLDMSRDISRLNNMFTVQIGRLTYAPDWGLDWDFWLNGDIQFQNQTVESWLKQEALKNNIVTSWVKLLQSGGKLLIDYRIASEKDQNTITVSL